MSKLELIMTIVSVAMFAGMLIAVPWLIRRLPADYFVREHGPSSFAIKVVRNVIGVVLIAVGIALLLLPGQGVITIVLGLSILDLPIKRRALGWLFSRPKIQEGIQKIRSKAGKPPLILEPA
jgi:hypothetical protein